MLVQGGTHRPPRTNTKPLRLVVPLGQPHPFYQDTPTCQWLRATYTSAPHCGHDLKLRELVITCSTYPHSTLSVCTSRRLMLTSMHGRSIQETEQFQLFYSSNVSATFQSHNNR